MKILQYRISDFTDKQIEDMKKFSSKDTSALHRQSIISNYFLKKELSRFYDCPMETIDICYGENGKPYYKDSLRFNITHSSDYVFIAFDSRELGIDVECIRSVDLRLASKIATKDERAAIEKSENPSLELLRLWTVKEAYFKLTGTGISSPAALSCDKIRATADITTTVTQDYILSVASVKLS